MPFDDSESAKDYYEFMTKYFRKLQFAKAPEDF